MDINPNTALKTKFTIISAFLPIIPMTRTIQRDHLLQDIVKTKNALDSAYSNFDNVIDPDLIDCYIYEVNAVQKRYKFLLEKASKLNMNLDLYPETP